MAYRIVFANRAGSLGEITCKHEDQVKEAVQQIVEEAAFFTDGDTITIIEE